MQRFIYGRHSAVAPGKCDIDAVNQSDADGENNHRRGERVCGLLGRVGIHGDKHAPEKKCDQNLFTTEHDFCKMILHFNVFGCDSERIVIAGGETVQNEQQPV